ncbi:hypothetical protein CPB84DRAFT_1850218 [Gymnopilus junonius]|uniref:Uncharacterized protein n=1 Tax=Gymnopilus junonius TaxID=109634 RepID=A0A9P5NG19_GYMJU|nr:hypothetical protein CPB84DRAFT_1850218 [Gymnopilus junonius]
MSFLENKTVIEELSSYVHSNPYLKTGTSDPYDMDVSGYSYAMDEDVAYSMDPPYSIELETSYPNYELSRELLSDYLHVELGLYSQVDGGPDFHYPTFQYNEGSGTYSPPTTDSSASFDSSPNFTPSSSCTTSLFPLIPFFATHPTLIQSQNSCPSLA